MASYNGVRHMIKSDQYFRAATILTMMLALGACGTKVGLGNPQGMPNETTSSASNASSSISTLPPLQMKKGQCAIFLWSEESSRPLVFTQDIATEHATILIDGTSNRLNRDQSTEMIIPGFFARQEFSDDTMKMSVRLKVDQGRNLYEGIKIPSGILSVKKNDDSENIISVSGLLGCNLAN